MGSSGTVISAGVVDENAPLTAVTPASLLTVISRPRPRYTFSVCDSSDVGDVTGSTQSASGVGGGFNAQFGATVGVGVGEGGGGA